MRKTALTFLALFVISFPCDVFAQNVVPLSPISRYACLLVGGKNKAIIPNAKGYRLANFDTVKSSLQDEVKALVLRRKTLREIKVNLSRQKAISKKQLAELKKIAKKFGFEPPDTSTSFDEQISKVSSGLTLIQAQINVKNAELANLEKCKRNKIKAVSGATRTIDSLQIDGLIPKLWVFSLYTVTTFSKSDVVSVCYKQWLGQYAGKFVPGLFRKNPCIGLNNSSCSNKLTSSQRGFVFAYSAENYGNLENAIASLTDRVINETPAVLEVAPIPASGKCSDYD